MKRSLIRFWHVFVMLICGLSLTVRGQDRIPIESLATGKSLFSIGVFSDNKGGHQNLTETLKVFRNRIKPRLIIGLGDHFNSEKEVRGMEESAAAAYGSTDAFYEIFYPVIGDNEDRILQGHKGRPDGAFKWGWFERCKIAKLDGTILRDSVKKYESTHGDYYAVLEEKGLRIHLVALYYPDTRPTLFPESLKFGESTCKMIKEKYPTEPMIVVAHQWEWWRRAKLPESSPIFKADIIMDASAHRYIIWEDVPGKSLAFNTAQLHSSRRQHVFEIRVFKDGFVLLALEPPKCLMGPMELHEWRKVWVKPFGKKPYPVLDWGEIRSIAPEILPPATNGFNRERALFHGFVRRYKKMPSIGELEKELNSSDPEQRAVAVLSLGYAKDAGAASKLLKKHLPMQKDPGIQAYAVMALYWTHPRVAVPLLNVLVATGKEALLTREDMAAIAKHANCPDKARLLTALIKTRKHYAVKHAIEAVHKEFNQDELKALIPFFIEELENNPKASAGVAIALGKAGPGAQPALPVLIERIDDGNRDMQGAVILAIGSIGGPKARKAIPKIKEKLKNSHPRVQWAAKKALQNLGQ